MSNSARENILSKLRKGAAMPSFEASDFSVITEKQATPEEKITSYKNVTQAVNTQVIEAKTTNWMDDLYRILDEKNIGDLMYGPKTALAQELVGNWDRNETTLSAYDSKIEACKEKLFSVDASITTALGAIAETGSLILWATKEEPRLLSLTPPIHIAVVKADQFYTTFYEAMTKKGWATQMPTNALLISGPSKTADIEQELCYGVHGPKELIVFILHD